MLKLGLGFVTDGDRRCRVGDGWDRKGGEEGKEEEWEK
jgi:hypothetical protein